MGFNHLSNWWHGRHSKLVVVDIYRRGCLAFALLAMVVCADAANGNYGGGNGNGDNPYLIFTAEHLAKIRLDSNGWDKHFKLMSGIDMCDYNTPGAFPIIGYLQWDPYISKPFKGVFDGNKKRIINLYITKIGHDFTGLFGYVSGKGALIKDLTLVNPKINALASGNSSAKTVLCEFCGICSAYGLASAYCTYGFPVAMVRGAKMGKLLGIADSIAGRSR